MDQINKNRGRIRAKTKQRTRESLGPANPRFQDPYHQSICPERGNSKAQTKSFLPEHKEQIKKKAKRQSREGKKNGGATISCLQKKNPKDSGATPGNKRKQPPRHRLQRRPPLHR